MSEEENLQDRIELLTDGYAKEILTGCYQRSMSAQELSWKYNIPIAAAYRRLKDLEEAGFMAEEEKKKGDKAARYKTSLKKAVFTFEDGNFSIKLRLSEEEEITSKFQRKIRWTLNK